MDAKYDNAEETTIILVGTGYIDATTYFLCFGSYTSCHLIDDLDINRRIAQENQSMGFIHPYFKCVHFDLFSKYSIFMEISMNLMLWGRKSLALRESHLNRLYVFMHTPV